ncbi:MAG TPA: Tm-1-like ATP-binding domain-containing protein [Vicinamibacterales bacterium]|nr:Tm-1-like ATP-binding domain-containing protein [Vicinamibacterales bacterium]
MSTVLLIGTLDTKGPEIAYLRDRLQHLGVGTIVADSGILGEPLDIVPDVTREEIARLSGTTIDALRQAGSRGKAVHGMLAGLRRLAHDLYADGRLHGVATLGGAEGAVLGASAMMGLPIGVPKIIVTPIASGHRKFGPLIGTKDIIVIHSVIDILGLNPISTTIFDNVAAALAGMVRDGHVLEIQGGQRRIAVTMLGQTTKGVMAVRDVLAGHGYEAVIFHANGVGGPAMEELAEQGLFDGVIDFTTNELSGEIQHGFHDAGPDRLRRIGRLGLPQVVVPGGIDFATHGRADSIPASLKGRPEYFHNPEFTLVRTSADEMREIGRRFAQRLNEATAPVAIMVPTEGLSIPNVPGGLFWDPDADAGFVAELRAHVRPDIPLSLHPHHVNDAEFARLVAERFVAMMAHKE